MSLPSMSYCSNCRTQDIDDHCNPFPFFSKNTSTIDLKTQAASDIFSRTSEEMLDSVCTIISALLLSRHYSIGIFKIIFCENQLWSKNNFFIRRNLSYSNIIFLSGRTRCKFLLPINNILQQASSKIASTPLITLAHHWIN